MEILTKIFLSFLLATIATLFWLYFWYSYSKKYTTPRRFLLKAGILGILVAIFSALLEKVILAKIFPGALFLTFVPQKTLPFPNQFLLTFGIAFFLTALPEELLKFLILKFFLFNSRYFNQIIDGIKFGLVLGLGFALVENSYFFFQHLTFSSGIGGSFFYLFLFRFFITTLAHSLYGGILGYYFGLSQFYKIFKNIFLWQGFLTVVIFHTFFNFLILTPLNLFTFLLLIFTLILVMKWYNERRNFQLALAQASFQKIRPPLFTEPREIQALIAQGTGSNFRILKKIELCPFCFKKVPREGKICHYCGQKFKDIKTLNKNGKSYLDKKKF